MICLEWKESLIIQTRALSKLLELETLEEESKKLLDLLRRVNGFVYFSGIGKNGFVAAKVASTFNSLGIRSLFVDPVNTLHGDMNIFTKEDLVIAISKSGETEELINFIKALKNVVEDIKIVCVTSNYNSTLEKLSHLAIHLPLTHEGDHLNLAPIASSVVFMAFLQSIAVQISSEKGFDKKMFVKGHPGGTLGKIKV